MNGSSIQKNYFERFNKDVPYVDETLERMAKIREIITKLPGKKKVLDVGCADGQVLGPIASKLEIYGVDISSEFVKKANKAGLKAKTHDVETAPLPYKDQEFDVVFNGETIEHMVDTDWFLSEINRVLKKKGNLVMTFPNVRTLTSLAMFFLDLPPQYSARYRAAHYRDFTLRTMKIALANHGFKIQQVKGTYFYLPLLGRFGGGLVDLLPSWSNHIIIVASKQKESHYDPEVLLEGGIY